MNTNPDKSWTEDQRGWINQPSRGQLLRAIRQLEAERVIAWCCAAFLACVLALVLFSR